MDNPIAKGVSMTSDEDVQFMRMTIEAARAGRRTPGGECVGAALVREGEAACITFNEGEMQHDPTAHAEIVAIRKLCTKLNTTDLKGYTIYCTLQPCGMCTMACLWAGISRIVYGAGRDDVHHIYFESRHNNTVDFIRDAFRNDLRIDGGVLAAECAVLYAKRNDDVSERESPAHANTAPPG
jgi:tRNA(adenine34) deaminase